MIAIKTARKSDLKDVQELNHQLFLFDINFESELNMNWTYAEGREYLLKRIQGEGVCLIALVESQIVGYLTGSVSERESWRNVIWSELETIFVKEQLRSKGVGSELVKAFISWSKQNNADRITVSMFAKNEEAVKFYRVCGFTDESIDLQYFL
ncbi:MAG: GNAT family N-acetyltransferase, partial [Candidatus Sungbacteria bacterium]|nr:GNAT family N-acetyltransferase [Candidatus Sungbacteria bacterium]